MFDPCTVTDYDVVDACIFTLLLPYALLAHRANTTGVPAYLKEHLVQRVHLVRPAQLHHRYCLSRDWPLISQDVHSPTPHLLFGTVCLQKSSCAIRNIVLKDILRHSCLIAVTKPSDRYLTSASAAFCIAIHGAL